LASRRAEPQWLTRFVIDAIHIEQIREHGGLPRVRDDTALESALARPQHKWPYRKRVDVPALGAAYAYGLVTSEPYRDGNKRIGFLAMATFLSLNGYEFDATDAEVVTEIVALAAGDVSEEALVAWVRHHSRRRD